MHRSRAKGCPGPLIWYETSMPCTCTNDHPAAILLCATCGYIVITGGWNDDAHKDTEVMREGLAA